MTTWVAAADGSTEYTQEINGTIWDDGLTLWDLDGNVFLTTWDGHLTTYNPMDDGDTVWA